MTFPLPKYIKIPVYQGFCSGKRAFFIISLLRYFLIKFKHLEENKMKTTENERKNAHYVIIQSITIGEDEYVLGKHETEEKYVTWNYAHDAYYYGHYIDDYATAKIDLYTRCINEMDYLKGKFENHIAHWEKERNNEKK